ITAYEIDAMLVEYLKETLESCGAECERNGIAFSCEVVQEDFIKSGSDQLRTRLFREGGDGFTHVILNPPYRKINSDSETRRRLRAAGIETSNLYTAFLALAAQMLADSGELVAITPRSFCNGSYFKPFRKYFLDLMSFTQIHVFESRDLAFGDDGVLQENIIFNAVRRTGDGAREVTISSSAGPDDEDFAVRRVPAAQVVRRDDPDLFIHIVPDDLGARVAERMGRFSCSLGELGVSVSTGRVVDFRAREHLLSKRAVDAAPLIYPHHFGDDGYVRHPVQHAKKPNWIADSDATRELLLSAGTYVLVKRFSAKEERKRVVAALYDPARFSGKKVGFENHINYFHEQGRGLNEHLAKGLVVFLNSSLVDSYFRQFNGHTQVNATDLRSLKYPTRGELEDLGRRVEDSFPGQEALDRLISTHLLNMTDSTSDPVAPRRKIEEAARVLKELGFPAKQQNERSALTLLALLDLRPDSAWVDAGHPLRGVTQMMDFFATHYGKRYAPNSRETVRRQTVHQFLEAGLIVANPDEPRRPINSGKTVYQIEEEALKLLRLFGSEGWEAELQAYLAARKTLREKYAQARRMNRIPVTMPTGQTFTLSAGGQNVLIAKIIEDFCPHFTPGGKVIYVGDADEKWAIFDEEAFRELGIAVDSHGKMPDVVVHHVERNWLVLIEAVTSHGPVDPKRRNELKTLFKGSSAGLVFVTAFLTRKAMVKYLDEISWETEVWGAESPDHLIHFNGERFLGPYEGE
ncbi:MAG: Eco57I restriction-modification methylase domain-containing protein, partial [Acidobacteriota bacterium]|nr:Eco57I restriction-modification methylase domain-containing protein [Acidobacteriota bacterium]